MVAIRLLFICLILPLSYVGQVHAQEPTATSSPVVTSTASTPAQKWYASEQIQGNINVGDFVVGPGKAEIVVSPGETITQEITVTNRISEGRTFTLEVEDIKGSTDGSSAVSLTGRERGPYSILDYISFPKTTFVLGLGERARIPVTITVPADAEPGGYYGSVLVSTDRVADKTSGDAGSRSPIIARVGSLFFLTVRGDIETSGQVKSIQTLGDKMWYEEGPIELGILYENTGSVHVNPYGEISITNMFGEEVGFIELSPWFVLPKSLRNLDVTWDRELLLGRYTVNAKINRGYNDIVDEVQTTFWVLPWKIVGGLFLLIFIIVFSIRAFFRTFTFTRKS